MGRIVEADEDDLGLESKEQRSIRRKRIHDAQMSVMLEQELQRDTNESDVNYIAEVCKRYTQESSNLAYHRALNNAAQVQNDVVAIGHRTCMDSIRKLVPSRWEGSIKGPEMKSLGDTRPCYPYHETSRHPHPWDQWAKHLSDVTHKSARWYFTEQAL